MKYTLLNPWLAASAPILLIAAVNVEEVDLKTFLLATALVLTIATGALILARGVARSWHGAAAVATLFMVLFYSHGPLLSALPLKHNDTGHGVLGLLWATILATFVWLLRRNPELGTRLSRNAFPFVLLFFALSVCQLAWAATRLQGVGAQPPEPAMHSYSTRQTTHKKLPDIYYLILDAYARSDQLSKHYGFDNSTFLSHLRDEGFYVAEESCCNYAQTKLSLASSLNMRHLHDEASSIGRLGLRRLIDNHLLGRYLKSKGYHYIHVNTNCHYTQSSKIADTSCAEAIPEFFDVLISSTLLEPFADELELNKAGSLRQQIDAIANSPQMATPKFVFAHLLCPHPPYLFDKDGREIASTDNDWSNKEGYLGQLEFINSEIKKIIDKIKKRSETPPIIIIQADHGPASTLTDTLPAKAQPELIRERMPILNAYHVPDYIRNRLYPDITPVNTFRLILTELFDDNQLPLVNDEVHFSWYLQKPFEFSNVTEILRSKKMR